MNLIGFFFLVSSFSLNKHVTQSENQIKQNMFFFFLRVKSIYVVFFHASVVPAYKTEQKPQKKRKFSDANIFSHYIFTCFTFFRGMFTHISLFFLIYNDITLTYFPTSHNKWIFYLTEKNFIFIILPYFICM